MKNPTILFPEPKKVCIEDRKCETPGEGEVLIKTECSLISTGTELTILSGDFPPNSRWAELGKFPFIPGYSNIGRIVDVGKNVNTTFLGKRVASYSAHSLYNIVRFEKVRIVPENISSEEASFFTIAEIVMNGVRRGKVEWGEYVGVYGLGLLGQLCVRFCCIAGALITIGIDISSTRLKYLPTNCRIIGINPLEEKLETKIKELTKNRMLDVVFEVTGNPEIIPKEFSILKKQGRFVVLSSPKGPTPMFDFHDLCNAPSYTIIGAHNASHPICETPYNPWTKKRHAEIFFDLVKRGELDIRSLISQKVHYSKAPQVYMKLLEDKSQVMGIIIEW